MRRHDVMLCAIAAIAVTTGVAAQNTPAAPPATDTAISKECQTPGVEISGNIPLPNVQRALRDRKVIRILTIGGSSATLLAQSRDEHRYIIEDMLEKTIQGVDVQIIDRGISGELARDAAQRIRTEVALAEPDLILWQLGASDAFAHVPIDEFEASVGSTLDWLKEHNVDVVLVGLQYLRLLRKDVQYQAMREAINRIATQHGVLRVSRYEAMQILEQARGSVGKPTPNEFAATEAGYACLSEYVVKALISGIFVRPPASRSRN